MYTPEVLQRCPVILLRDSGARVGTGFILETSRDTPPRHKDPAKDEIPGKYVVTAAHNLLVYSKTEDVVVACSDADNKPTKIRIPMRNWRRHPSNPDVDVAVAEWPGITSGNTTLNLDDCATDDVIDRESIGLGDHLYVSGLFHRLTAEHAHTPIVRTGNIAMMPNEPVRIEYNNNVVKYVRVFLIEVRSVSGLSGSPVFVSGAGDRMRKWTDDAGKQQGTVYALQNPRTHLLGLVHGRWQLPKGVEVDAVSDSIADEAYKINTGIAMVVPTEQILEVVNHPDFVAARKEAFRRESSSRAATLDTLVEHHSADENRAAKSMIDRISKRTEG